MAQEHGNPLPPGYVFQPSDAQTLGYLARKIVNGVPPPFGVVPELDVYDVPPWRLPGNLRYSIAGEFYCFTRLRRSNPENTSPDRSVGSFGSWVACGKHDRNISDRSGRTVGHKTFYNYKSSGTASADTAVAAAGGNWIMYEYRLEEAAFPSARREDVRDAVICLIKRSGKGVNKPERRQQQPLASAPSSGAATPSNKRNASMALYGERPPVVQCCKQSSDVARRSVIPSVPLSSAMQCPPSSPLWSEAAPLVVISPAPTQPEVLLSNQLSEVDADMVDEVWTEEDRRMQQQPEQPSVKVEDDGEFSLLGR